MTDLLEQASQCLTGEIVPRHAIRAACWFGRAALDAEVSRLLRARGLEPGSASTRSLLSCLESAYAVSDRDIVEFAEYAWVGLSQAAHEHAFELAPTAEEARHLLALVARLRDTSPTADQPAQ